MRVPLVIAFFIGSIATVCAQQPKVKTIHPAWIELTNLTQAEAILMRNTDAPIILFKHSTACSVSGKAFDHLKANYKVKKKAVLFYYLDLLSHRDISALIEQKTGVKHHSPQVIVWHNGNVLYSVTHQEINWKEIQKIVKQ